jgi:curved DNA-binding protein CbpA
MTYYDELGVPPTADAEEIRRAYHNLCRILHPDNQIDEELRRTAEQKMRHLNAIREVLLDSQKRILYDRALLHRSPPIVTVIAPPGIPISSHISRVGSVAGMFVLAAAALAVILMIVFWIANGYIPWPERERETESAGATAPTLPASDENQRHAARQPVPAHPGSPPPAPLLDPRRSAHNNAVPSATEDKAHTIPELRKSDNPGSGFLRVLAVDPPALPAPSPDANPLPIHPDISPPGFHAAQPNKLTPAIDWRMLTGVWVYAPEHSRDRETHQRLYAPEFIKVQIHLERDKLYGTYSAEYRVPDRRLSPAVAFGFETGPSSNQLTGINWRAPDGSQGTVDLLLQDANQLRVNWRTIRFGASMSLGAGTALLIRRAD